MRLVLRATSTASSCAPASCSPAQAEGAEVVTVEGLAPATTSSHPIQQAFVDAGAVQCGFCTPGLIVATHDLLARNPMPSDAEIREALAGNLCRCTGYEKILDAVRIGRGGADRVSAADEAHRRPADGIGAERGRPDGTLKVRGEFAYSSDLWANGMLWGTTLRSPHPYARIRSIDFAEALALPGVLAILTHEDVPGRKTYGLELPDQPVLASDLVRYQGEPVAIVAADHPETARRAAELIEVDYEVLEPLVDMDRAVEADEPRAARGRQRPAAPARRARRRRGGADGRRGRARATTRSACRTRPSSAPSPASRSRARTAASTCYVATQWLHVDRAPDRGEPRPAAREGATHARRCRGRVRRPRGPLDADPRAACSRSTPAGR